MRDRFGLHNFQTYHKQSPLDSRINRSIPATLQVVLGIINTAKPILLLGPLKPRATTHPQNRTSSSISDPACFPPHKTANPSPIESCRSHPRSSSLRVSSTGYETPRRQPHSRQPTTSCLCPLFSKTPLRHGSDARPRPYAY